jgi:D-3-phosphoglycerate dehydrogenase
MTRTRAHDQPEATSYPLHKIKVVLLEGVHALAEESLAGAGYQVERHAGALEGDDLVAVAGDAHLLGIRSKTRLTPAFFEAASRLWGVGCFCIGTNQVALESAADAGVAVFNAPFANTRSVAEMTIAEIIGLARGVFEASHDLRAGRWRKTAAGRHEVRGRTLGIVGYGHIGSQVSVLAEAMGMRVCFFDIAHRLPLGNAEPVDSLDDLLARADVVTLHVPGTARTRGLISAERISQMRPGSLLINNARGDVVDLDALAAALRTGRIGGAAVDVFPSEPTGDTDAFESPLTGAPNVVLTPHIGGSTEEAQRSIALEVAGKLARYMNNGSTLGSVNLPEVDLPTLRGGAHRILHYHRNVPGVLSKLHTMIADLGVNITAEHLQSNARFGYVILDVEEARGEEIKQGLAKIPETVRVRTLW